MDNASIANTRRRIRRFKMPTSGSGGCLAPLGIGCLPVSSTWQALTIEEGAGFFSQHHSSAMRDLGWGILDEHIVAYLA